MQDEWCADEYNFGTLIRANVEDDYTQENSIFGVSSFLSPSALCGLSPFCQLTRYGRTTGYRLQFYAIEIARNRRGLNDKVYELVRPPSPFTVPSLSALY